MAELIGREEFSDYGKHRQVYLATHDGEGNRLPQVNRAYISFSYGGKWIEDFNLIATMEERLNKNVYAEFEDTTTEYDTLDGQYYWGTRSKANQLSFMLATDGMTQEELDNFKFHFRPGIEKELILAEHPNRAIKARVAGVPTISMIPFETIQKVYIQEQEYNVLTALYRGSITLSFVMDDPYWYGRLFYMPHYLELENFDNNSEDYPTKNMVETKSNLDCLKICLEDHLPFSEDLPYRTFFGNDNYILDSIYDNSRVGIAIVDHAIAVDLSIGPNSTVPWYVFYSGTAPSKPFIKYTIEMDYDDNDYIIFPSGADSAQIGVGSNIFVYKLPAIYNGYNKAIEIINNSIGMSPIEIKNELRDEVKESITRQKGISLINNLTNDIITEEDKNLFIQKMKEIFENNLPKATFEIDSSTGSAEGTFYLNEKGKIKQKVGDMIFSLYLIIDERCNFSIGQKIQEKDCLLITSSEKITDFLILFKNMYL